MNFNLSTASLAGLVKDHEGGLAGTGGASSAAGPENPVAPGFAALLAGADTLPDPGYALFGGAGGTLDKLALADAWAELAQEFVVGEDGNILPPAGLPLPLPITPARLPGLGDDAAGGGQPGAPTDPLARMLSLFQLLQVTGTDTPPGVNGAGPLTQAGMELVRVEPVETPRQSLPLVAMPATAVTAAASAGEPTQPPAFPLSAQPGRPEWGNAVGERVLWMAANRVQVAHLRLNPPELGPVEVRVRLEDDSLRLAFSASTSGARDALEAAAPRLREIFMAEGLQLGSLDIEQRERGERQESDAEALASESGGETGESNREDGAEQHLALHRAGLVDLFV